MNTRKAIFNMMCLLFALSFVLAACSSDETTNEEEREKSLEILNESGMPIVKEPIELTGFGGKFIASQDWNDLMLWKEYEKMTNIKIHWETVQNAQLAERRNLMLTTKEYPDIMFATAMGPADLLKYGRQGIFQPLNDLIDQYAPNFKRLMEQYPIIEQGITMADGNIYSFPVFYDPEFLGLRIGGTPWINQKWLDDLGLKDPTTIDEFYEVLKAFKEEIPNSVPYGSAGGINSMINYLRGSFGLNKYGTANVHLDLEPGTNNLRFIPATENYKQLLQYLHKLYKEELIDPEIFTITQQEIYAKAAEGNYGVIHSVDPGTLWNLTDYVGAHVLEGPGGRFLTLGSPLGTVGQFMVTDKNKHPEASVRWMDYFFSDEGVKMFFMGFEGITYEEKDGKLVYTEHITNHPDGINLDQAVSLYLMWPGGNYPGFVREEYFQGAEAQPSTRAKAEKAQPYAIDQNDIWPRFNYTEAESDELVPIQNDIHTYVDEMTANFIAGRESFDNWDQYVETLNKMGLKRYLEINQAAYERMMGN